MAHRLKRTHFNHGSNHIVAASKVFAINCADGLWYMYMRMNIIHAVWPNRNALERCKEAGAYVGLNMCGGVNCLSRNILRKHTLITDKRSATCYNASPLYNRRSAA